MDHKPWRHLLQYRPETPNSNKTPSLTENGYLKLTAVAAVPAILETEQCVYRAQVKGLAVGVGVRKSRCRLPPIESFHDQISQEFVLLHRQSHRSLNSHLMLGRGRREQRCMCLDGIEDARYSKGGGDETGGLRHPTPTCLPHRRTRAMVGLVSPLSTIVPATTPTNVSFVHNAEHEVCVTP